MICPACGNENLAEAAFCEECGGRLTAVCPKCGSDVGPTAKFCRACGAALSPTSPASRVQPSQPALPSSFCEGRYEVKRFLGEGGKKRVFLAHDARLDRDVAFALIKTDGLDADGLTRIRREAQAMGRLGDHPHIVSVYDIGEEAGQPFIVTQLMGGGDVEGLIEKAEGHRVPLETAGRIADQVCQALDYAHSRGIVHRDLKPGNVWLTPEGTAKLGDFGLALALDRSRLTQAGMMVGTVSYMPPEQAIGGEVTARSDLYSLGAMLYELATGRPPFVGDESVAIITQHLNTPPVTPSWHAPDVSPGLEALILRLLEKDPAKRPASAAEVRSMLAAALAPTPTPPPTLPQAQGGLLGEGQTTVDGPPPPKLGEGPGVRAVPQPPPPSPIYRRTFVGREEELRQLKAAFDGAISGQGALVLVVGEPGIGKTALCEQLATYAAVRGGRSLVGHCYEEGSLSLPYLPFVEAMRTYVLARDPEGLKADLGSGAADVARIISEIRDKVAISPGPSPNPSTGSGQAVGGGVGVGASPDADDDRWRLLQAVAGFLKNAAAVQPIVLVLEDLHWADRGTLDLLLHLARNLQGARLLIVGTYRDVEVDRAHPLSAALAELRRVGDLPRVLLRGLTPDEVHRMIGAISGQDVRWSLAEAVHRQTEGNPLFVQEVLRYLAEEGLIVRQEGRWRRSGEAPPEMSIPEGLRDVIGRRLSRLSAECNRLLAIAAVVGRDFRLDTLQVVAGLAEEQLIAGLEEATRVGVLEEQARIGVIRYRFAHAFFRQTLYEELSAPRRLRVHQEVARALEAQYAARPEEHAAELAEHFAQSTDPADLEKAVRYGELAARRSMAVCAYSEAAHHLESALDVQEVLDPDDRLRRCDLLLALAEALGPAGEPQRVVEQAAEEAFALAEALEDKPRAARSALLAIEGVRRYGGGGGTSSPLNRRWVERLDRYAAPDSQERIQADLALAGVLLAGEGRWAEQRKLRDRAGDLATQLHDVAGFVHFASWALFHHAPRTGETDLPLARKAIAMGREGVSARRLADFQHVYGWACLQAGDRDGAERAWQEEEGLAAHSREASLLIAPLVHEGSFAMLDGDLDGAVAAAARVVARADELGSPVAGHLAAQTIAFRPLLYLGRADQALATVVASRQRGSWLAARSFYRLGQRAVCLAHMGRADDARAQLAQDLGSAEISEDTPTRVLAALLETAVLLGDRDTAARLAPLLAAVTAHGVNFLMSVSLPVGAAHVLLGDPAAARASYDRSLEWATKIRYRPEIALTRLAMAELLLDEAVGHQQSAVRTGADEGKQKADELKAEGSRHLDFAIEEFRAMKMQPSLERALRHKGLLRA